MKGIRRGLLITTALLVVTGVIMVYSTSAIYAKEVYEDAGFFLRRHLMYLCVGLFLSGWILTLDPQQIRKAAKPLLLVSLLLLLAVLVPGIGAKVSGARRWFRLGPVSIQPSEIAQLAVLIYLADVLNRKRAHLGDFFQGVLPPLLVLGSVVCLILAEPDLGTAVAIGFVALVLLFIAGAEGKALASLALMAVPVVAGLIALKPYRIRRIVAYLNPWADPEGAGFQLIQSLVALGSGGVAGVGLGESKQKLFYLPAAHTDFIFSVLGEELGLLGVTAVILLMAAFVWFGIRLASRAPDTFGAFTGYGIVFLLAFEALVHIGVATGAIPTKGLPFPFISYGGSALVVNLVSVAILLNVSRPQPAVIPKGPVKWER
ncbi:MAG: putative lipid II flippase FtsW [Candidatus Omnitrophica bacterium]|nr:putative lipid II flippase FtsW [Candidatus Omnitrophota bacterium]